MCVGTEQTSNILKDDEAGPQNADGVGDVVPDSGAGARPEPSAFAGMRHVLAWEPGRDDCDRGHGGPVDGCDVAEVGRVGESGLENLGRVLVVFAHPCCGQACDLLDGQI
jgi:hypothetical protein